MASKLKIAIEEPMLEVDRYLEEERQRDMSSDYDNLYLEIQKDNEDEESNTDEVDDQIQQDAIVASESFRSLEYNIAVENLSDIGTSVNIMLTAGIVFIRDTIKALARLGITYGPVVLSKLYKVVLIGITKLCNFIINSIIELDKYITRTRYSFHNLKEDIDKLKKSLDIVKNSEIKDSLQFSNTLAINSLKIGSSVDIISNIKQLQQFISFINKDINKGIDKDIEAIKHIMNFVVTNHIENPLNLMEETTLSSSLTKTDVVGFEERSDLIDSYSYDSSLPGDIRFIAFVPSKSIDNIDDYSRAYNQSNMFLGFDQQHFQSVKTIDYMTKDELQALLQLLIELCNVGLDHMTQYETIIDKKKRLRYSVKLYISALISSSSKMNMKQSLLDFVNLKLLFIDKIYLSASMDIHDYLIKVITQAMKYSQKNIQVLAEVTDS